MITMAVPQQRPSPVDDFGLDAVAQHNAATSIEQFPEYHEDAKGLGIYHDGVYSEEQFSVNPPTPRSNTASEGIRTRSGRSTKRTDSPFSVSNARISKSPSVKPKKEKKSKLDKTKTPKLTAPLSVLTKDMDVPLKDMDAWVNRPADVRRKEVEKRNGYVTRPMNSFMLYRSCYAERTKQWCTQNNHQVVSAVSGESWPMEPEEVRNQFNEWSKIERANHAAAHPEYKFSPSKAGSKRRKGEFTDDEEEGSDLDHNPDGEYRGGRNVRQRRHHQDPHAAYIAAPVGFDSHPYYGQQGYEIPQYGYANPGQQLRSNIAYDAHGMPYDPQTGTYLSTSVAQHPSYAYVPSVRIPTPSSQNLGGYGLPGGQMNADELFAVSRTATPAMHQQQHYNQYYAYQTSTTPQQLAQAYQPPTPVQTQAQQQQIFEHQQYLQQASQPQAAIDPALDAALAAAGESHFDDALGDLGNPNGAELSALVPTEYFEESTSPNQTLAPTWSPTDPFGGP